jgi:molecular chaperone GrpE
MTAPQKRKREIETESVEAQSPVDPELEEDLAAMPDLEAELDAAREEAARNLAAAQHWQAEFENFRKRQTAQAADQATRAGQRIVEELLPVLDNLDRAIDHTVRGGDLEHLVKGVESVHTQIMGVFKKEGVEEIDPFGSAFDPTVHQAVNQVEDPGVPEHTVVEVFQKGYLMGGRVVRPAMVVVSTGGPARKAEKAE